MSLSSHSHSFPTRQTMFIEDRYWIMGLSINRSCKVLSWRRASNHSFNCLSISLAQIILHTIKMSLILLLVVERLCIPFCLNYLSWPRVGKYKMHNQILFSEYWILVIFLGETVHNWFTTHFVWLCVWTFETSTVVLSCTLLISLLCK